MVRLQLLVGKVTVCAEKLVCSIFRLLLALLLDVCGSFELVDYLFTSTVSARVRQRRAEGLLTVVLGRRRAVRAKRFILLTAAVVIVAVDAHGRADAGGDSL